jgi:hypothetical protein
VGKRWLYGHFIVGDNMPSNINEFINTAMGSFKEQSSRQANYVPKSNTLSDVFGPVDRKAHSDDPKSMKEVISGGIGDAYALVAGFLYERLAQYTTVDRGYLSGAWTAGQTEVNGQNTRSRSNKTMKPLDVENREILQLVINGDTINIRNASEYARLINAGSVRNAPHAFVENAIRDTKAYAKSLGIKVTGG